MKKYLPAGILGNLLEWYDFAIYGYVASIIANLYFPSKNEITSLLLAFIALAGGFFARPIGGAVFGYYGDKYGRRNALIISIILMSIATIFIGLLPSYKNIGIFAPILLTILLLVQGFAVSGEFTGSASFLSEHSNISNRGYIGSLLFASCIMGKLFACFIVTIFSMLLTHQEMLNFGWRMPFVLSGLFGLIVLFIRFNVKETPVFEMHKSVSTFKSNPTITVLKHNKLSVITTIFICCLMSIACYTLIVYLPSFTSRLLGFSLKKAMLMTTVSLLILTILLPIMGKISDKIGRKPVMLFGSIGFIFFSIPIFKIINLGGTYTMLGEVCIAILLAPVAAPIMSSITELYETNIRYSGSSIGYNLSLTLFGGTAPLICLWLTHKLNSNTAPGLYLTIGALLTSLAIFFLMPETYKISLDSKNKTVNIIGNGERAS